MNIERDESKKERLSFRLQALEDSEAKLIREAETDINIAADNHDLFKYLKHFYQDVEKMELVGIEHTDAMMIAVLLRLRSQA